LKLFLAIVLATLIIISLLLCYIRFSRSDQYLWHIDPELVLQIKKKNSFLLNSKSISYPYYPYSADELYSRLITILDNENCKRLFGNIEDRLITFICRSKIIGFPDYVSVRFIEYEGGKSSISVFSRSRFGVYDFGKNKNRVLQWLEQIK